MYVGLSSDIATKFAKLAVNSTGSNGETSVYGTVRIYDGATYVKLDGSDILTPVSTTVDAEDGERVIVLLKNHSAIVTGNASSPAARIDTVNEIAGYVSELQVGKLDVSKAEITYATIGALNAATAEINTLKTNKLDASSADIKYATIESLSSTNAEINTLKTNKLDASAADIKYATIGSLNAVNAEINTLKTNKLDANDADIKYATIGSLNATNAEIDTLKVNKLDATTANAKYATIDFSNISEATMQSFYANSGLIKDVVVEEGVITGELVGVTIKGDLIEANTIKADKLVILGEDGFYYALNTNGETVESKQTDQNSLDGSHIKANTITASKINVSDLVAFDATIGGFKITENSLYSGVKESMDNTTPGIFLSSEGLLNVGNSNNYIKFYKDANGAYKLAISVDSMTISSTGKTVEELVGNAQAAAEEAQDDVDTLAVKVTTAETKIEQNTEKIEQNTEKIQLAATKTEVTETLGGYYTKSEADSAITLKANEITQTVSKTYTEKNNAVKEIHRYYTTGTASSNTVEWDGTGELIGGVFYKISDAYIPASVLEQGGSITVSVDGEETIYNFPSDDVMIMDMTETAGTGMTAIMIGEYQLFMSLESAVADDGMTVPAGSYFLNTGVYPSAMTLNARTFGSVPAKPTTYPATGSDTVTWDGNTEGYVTNDNTTNRFYKVSSAVPTVADLQNGGSFSIYSYSGDLNGGAYTSTEEIYLTEGDNGALALLTNLAVVIPYDNYFYNSNFGTFPEAGVYFLVGNNGYLISWTINNYTGFEGVWSETEPEYEQGKSLYSTDCTVYADGSFVYSDVSMSSAQEGANKAAEKTEALAERVTQAETSITQNTNQIALSATKTEVAEALDGYYTKSETEAELKVESDRISAVVESVSEVSNSADNNAEAIEKAYSMLNQLAESLSTLVVGEDGASLMKQTENGWQFDFGAIKKEIDDQFEVYGNHITFGEYDGKPCIKLNQDDSDFAVLITNEEILFMEGSNAPTKICDNTLVTENIEVKQELRQGGFVWVLHGGNLGLMWKGVDG